MVELFGLNPVAEAMVYYSMRANGSSVEKRIAELKIRFPEQKTEIDNAAKYALSLEKLLNSKLDVDDELVAKYFKKIGTRYPNLLFGFCIAFIMIANPLTANLEYSPDELFMLLREADKETQLFYLCFGLLDRNEPLKISESSIEEFSERLENLQLSYEYKWKIISIFISYRTHLEELISLLTPAVKLIQSVADRYKIAVDEFRRFCSNEDILSFLETRFNYKFENIKSIKIAPLLFGFNGKFSITNAFNNAEEEAPAADDRSASRMIFLGIGQHILNLAPHDDVTKISEQMQALSDITRLKILFYLCSCRAYGQELCTKFEMVRSVLSYHMSKLLSAGFVTAEFDGGKTYYTADKAGIQRMLDAFAEKIK